VALDPPNVLFAGFVRPFAQVALARVSSPILPERALAALAVSLVTRLAMLASRVLLRELARDREAGTLPGADARERFRAFSAAVASPERRRRILDQEPGLERALAGAVERWAVSVGELLLRYGEERGAVGEALHGAGMGALAQVTTHLSDPHRGGRTVAMLVDEDGRRVIYKPRSLALDERFQTLLAWLELPCPHQRVRVVDRGEHGWVEVVAQAPCADRAAVDRFFFRQGSFLALLHVLRGVDFHHENVIAAGEHPVLVDLEALFQHRLRPASGDALFETGLLPRRVFRRDGGEGIDLSGLGGPKGEAVRMNAVIDVGLDTMRLGPREVVVPAGKSRPVLEGRAHDAAESIDAIIAGFRQTWQQCARRRDELRELLAGFAGVEVRFFARATQRYVLTSQEGEGGPMWQSLEADAGPLAPLVPSERADLRDGDIPVFLARPGSRHLWDARGRRMDDLFARSSLAECEERLDGLGDEACEEHVALIRRVIVG
jgi:type 2 lantibiotic biosynthesis protein LanM